MLNSLIRKEIKEMLTRSALVYMIILASIFALTGQMISSSQESAADKPVVALVSLDSGIYATMVTDVLAESAELAYTGNDPAAARQALESAGGTALLTIPQTFTRDILAGEQARVEILWLMRGAGIMDSLPQQVVQVLLDRAALLISTHLIEENSNLNATVVLQPAYSFDTTEYKGKVMTGLTPGEVSNILGSQTMVVPIAVMMLILMASTSVISSMGMEKENRTLETLLTMPIRRSQIIVSKIVGSAVAGLAMGLIYMAGFYSYFSSLGASAADLTGLGLALGALDYMLVGLSVFAALMAALSLSIILGTFASNYRAAQTLTFPIIGLAMLPMLLTMFQDFDTMSLPMRVLLFAIPFSHPMMAMKALMMDNYLLVVSGIAYSLAVTAVLVAVAAWIFTSDRVVTGMVRSKLKLSGLLARK
jgi:ABC-2 type transport system permease protein